MGFGRSEMQKSGYCKFLRSIRREGDWIRSGPQRQHLEGSDAKECQRQVSLENCGEITAINYPSLMVEPNK